MHSITHQTKKKLLHKIFISTHQHPDQLQFWYIPHVLVKSYISVCWFVQVFWAHFPLKEKQRFQVKIRHPIHHLRLGTFIMQEKHVLDLSSKYSAITHDLLWSHGHRTIHSFSKPTLKVLHVVPPQTHMILKSNECYCMRNIYFWFRLQDNKFSIIKYQVHWMKTNTCLHDP